MVLETSNFFQRFKKTKQTENHFLTSGRPPPSPKKRNSAEKWKIDTPEHTNNTKHSHGTDLQTCGHWPQQNPSWRPWRSLAGIWWGWCAPWGPPVCLLASLPAVLPSSHAHQGCWHCRTSPEGRSGLLRVKKEKEVKLCCFHTFFYNMLCCLYAFFYIFFLLWIPIPLTEEMALDTKQTFEF